MNDLIATIDRAVDGSTIDLRRDFPVSPDVLWSAIVSPDLVARWMGVLSGELKEGGNYKVVFDESDPSAVVEGEIRRCVDGQELAVTWQAPGDGVSVVAVTLTPADGGTEMHLVHKGLSDKSDTGHAAGWQVHLDQLAGGLAKDDWSDKWDQWETLQKQYAERL